MLISNKQVTEKHKRNLVNKTMVSTKRGKAERHDQIAPEILRMGSQGREALTKNYYGIGIPE